MAAWVYLLTATAYDKAAGEAVTVRWGSRDYVTRPTDTPADTLFEGVGLAWRFERAAFRPGQVGGGSLSGSGSFTVKVPQEWRGDGTLAWLLRLAWDGWAFEFRRVRAGAAYATAETIAAGTAAPLEQADAGELVLRAHDPAEDLARRPLALSYYAGTGGDEGGAELANRPRLMVFGRVDNARVEIVDPAVPMGQAHAGATHAIDALRDSGVALVAAGSSSPASGEYWADLAAGELILGDQPVGAVTVDIRGATASGVWKDDLADVFRHVATAHAGIADPAGLDTDALAALAIRRPYVIGYATDGGDLTVADLFNDLVGGAGGAWFFRRDGRLSVWILTAPTATGPEDPAVSLVVRSYDMVPGSIRRTVPGIPPYEVRPQYRALGYVQSADDLAGSVSSDDRTRWSTPHRTGSTGVDAVIQTAHRRSEPLVFMTWCYDQADAEAIGADLADVLDDLVLLSFQVEADVGAVEIGAEIWLECAEYGYPDGVAAVVLGYAEDQTGFVTLEVGIT